MHFSNSLSICGSSRSRAALRTASGASIFQHLFVAVVLGLAVAVGMGLLRRRAEYFW